MDYTCNWEVSAWDVKQITGFLISASRWRTRLSLPGTGGSRSAAVRGRDGIQCPQPGQYAGRRAVDVLFEHIIFRGVADVRMEIF